uniref:Uncharacterized protein n=1 Tax=Rhizophora mucronata TaxID=61149 RepID=A0A2P2NIL1_RHIMU
MLPLNFDLRFFKKPTCFLMHVSSTSVLFLISCLSNDIALSSRMEIKHRHVSFL